MLVAAGDSRSGYGRRLRSSSELGRHDRVSGWRIRHGHPVRALHCGPTARLRRRLLPPRVHYRRRRTGAYKKIDLIVINPAILKKSDL